jgi:hypothetical protein
MEGVQNTGAIKG